MRHARVRFCLLVPVALGIQACDDPTAAPSADLLLEGGPMAASLATGHDYYLEPVTIERTSGRQTVTIPLADRPWLEFMDPFRLSVVKSDSIRGAIALDGAAVLNLRSLATGDTAVRRLRTLGPASALVVTLTGRARGTVTIWIAAKLQPAPVFTLESPIRSEMLDSGVTSFGVVPVRGRVCHPHYPITSLKLFATSLPVPGDSLCASFNTTTTMPFGTGLVLMEATNSRGRTGYLVQSLLRADHWVLTDADATQTLNLVNGPFIVLAPSGLDDNNRADLDDIATIVQRSILADSLEHFPAVLYDGEPVQPFCTALQITRRGYRIERDGPVSFTSAGVATALVPGGAQLNLGVNQVVVPVLVRGFVKRSCETPLVGVSRGTATYASGNVQTNVALAVQNGTIVASPQQPFANLGALTLTISFARGSQLTLAQQTEAIDRIRIDLSHYLTEELRLLGVTGADSVGSILARARLVPGAEFDRLGIDVTPRIGSLSGTTSMLTIGFRPQIVVPDVRSIAPSPRGPVNIPELPDVVLTRPALGIVSINHFNAIFWGAWRAGYFDYVNLLNHPAAPPIDGLRVGLRPMLPPTLQFAPQGNFFRIGWGDLRLDLTIDPSVWGDEDPGAEDIRARAWGHAWIDVDLVYDAAARRFTWQVTQIHSFTRVQLPASFPTWIDQEALRAALEQLLWDVAPQLVVDAMSAAPIPVGFDFTMRGAAGTLELSPLTAVRRGIHLDLSGGIVAN